MSGQLQQSPISNVYSVAARADEKEGIIYYSTYTSINSVHLDGTESNLLYTMSANWESGFHLDISKKRSFIFFSLYSRSSDGTQESFKIMRADLTGRNPKELHSGFHTGEYLHIFTVPLAVDDANERIYFLDPVLQIIFSSDFEGQDKKVFAEPQYRWSTGMSVDEEGMYLIYDGYTSLMGCIIANGGNSCVPIVRLAGETYFNCLKIYGQRVFFSSHSQTETVYHVESVNFDGTGRNSLFVSQKYILWLEVLSCGWVDDSSKGKNDTVFWIVGSISLAVLITGVVVAAVIFKRRRRLRHEDDQKQKLMNPSEDLSSYDTFNQ